MGKCDNEKVEIKLTFVSFGKKIVSIPILVLIGKEIML